MTIVSASNVAEALRKAAELPAKRASAALYRAAQRGRNLLVERSPVDQGIFKNGWDEPRAIPGQVGWEVVNRSPNAAIVEEGSRPHMPPVQPLYEWVKRQMGKQLKAEAHLVAALAGRRSIGKRGLPQAALIDKRAMSLAWAIAMSIKKKGTKPHRVAEGAQAQLEQFVVEEIRREFRRQRR